MNLKLLLGVVIPLLVVISLVILSSSGKGFTVEVENVKAIQFDYLFNKEGYQRPGIIVQTIKLRNDFFLPRRFDLPILAACLNDVDGKQTRQNVQMAYSGGESSAYSGQLDYTIYNPYSKQQTIEIPAHSTREAKLFLTSQYIYTPLSNGNVSDYRMEYDEVLLVEHSDRSYKSCLDLNNEELENSIRIPILK